jgi:hypothetical protein
MSTELADRLAELWYDECQERALPTDPYHPLRQGLRDFLPGDAPAGIAYRDEHPFVVALGHGALLLFAPPEPRQTLDVLALPLGSVNALAIASANTSTNRANYRVCTWTSGSSDCSSQSFCTRSPVGAGFDADNGGEAVMLALAEQIGWLTPLNHVRTDSK